MPKKDVRELAPTIAHLTAWAVVAASLLPVADDLDMTVADLTHLLVSNGIADLNSKISPNVNAQDAINVILLYFALQSSYQFSRLGWINPR